MKIEELRIGNWIKLKNSFDFKVQSIKNIWIVSLDDANYHFTDCEGIPISEEWMLKFGFEKNHKHGIENYVFNNFTYYPSNKQVKIYDRFGGSLYVENIQFVHQLQNLYFALTQQEL